MRGLKFPGEDLNPHKKIQSLLCYHYTTGNQFKKICTQRTGVCQAVEVREAKLNMGLHADSPCPAAGCEAARERGRYSATRGMGTNFREAKLNMGPHADSGRMRRSTAAVVLRDERHRETPCGFYPTIGIAILNAVPSFFLLVNVRLPSCASTIFFTIVMPRPVPPSAPRV